ncbi:unnamed protein product [Protopolystoma xenopodis]|uniref:Secreted protein n=1 Tax=Protopolystoma xenopodis TaxID=117903 RepID=A0A448WRQ9_9PLAT|nr:unnamed protein product [Protopolystoma xenopodis]
MLTHLLLVCVTVIHLLLYPLASPSTSSHSLHRPGHMHTSLAVCQLIHLPIDRLVGLLLPLFFRLPPGQTATSNCANSANMADVLGMPSGCMSSVCTLATHEQCTTQLYAGPVTIAFASLLPCPICLEQRNINVCTGFDGRLYRLAGLDATSSLANGSKPVSLLCHADSANQAAAENAFHRGHIT